MSVQIISHAKTATELRAAMTAIEARVAKACDKAARARFAAESAIKFGTAAEAAKACECARVALAEAKFAIKYSANQGTRK